jgi:hypothetical protein
VTKFPRTKLIDLQKIGTLIRRNMYVIQQLFLPQIYWNPNFTISHLESKIPKISSINWWQLSSLIPKTSKPNVFFYWIWNPKIPKISSSFGVQVESEMMDGGRVGKNSYQSRYSSSSSMFNGDVRVFQCWCLRIW